jgi:hypothetical protein
MQNQFQTLMTSSQETKRKIATASGRVRMLLIEMWMAFVLVAFFIIRILQSNSAHKLSSWWKAH